MFLTFYFHTRNETIFGSQGFIGIFFSFEPCLVALLSFSSIGRDDFFFHFLRKVLNLFKLKNTFSWFDFSWFDFSLLTGRQTPPSNSERVKVTKNVINF